MAREDAYMCASCLQRSDHDAGVYSLQTLARASLIQPGAQLGRTFVGRLPHSGTCRPFEGRKHDRPSDDKTAMMFTLNIHKRNCTRWTRILHLYLAQKFTSWGSIGTGPVAEEEEDKPDLSCPANSAAAAAQASSARLRGGGRRYEKRVTQFSYSALERTRHPPISLSAAF